MCLMKTVQINEAGLRIGQDHPKAVLTDRDVRIFFELRAQGMGYRKLAAIFEISKSHARNMCKGRARCQTATRFKEVKA
jgi:hypothetical protein